MMTGSVRITRLVRGVMLARLFAVATVSVIAVWIAARLGLRRRKVLIGTRFFIWRPCATTTGSVPSVSTSSQSRFMARSLTTVPRVGPRPRCAIHR